MIATDLLVPLSIPSPDNGVWHLGPLPIRGYALCIILGIVAAIWLGEKRWQARGGRPGEIQDLAVWAVPFGVVGARLYHVATDWKRYFGEGGSPIEALYIWKGGLGIWGAVALGAVGAILWARRKNVRLGPVVDTLAPGVILAQAIGRWGNWFNQELYGKPTDLPWGLEIDPVNWPDGLVFPAGTTFHPTFLYEFLWNLGVLALLLWAEKRYRLGHGRVFALYVMGYTLGRGWIEYLRVDSVQLDDVYGLRFNVWTSIVLFLVGLAGFVWSARRHPGREESVYRDGHVEGADQPEDEEGEAIDDDEERAAVEDGVQERTTRDGPS
ncbi:prolipoprotein diacylglyceryl transferase [Nocardioides litoris]|uniref:prolipoprotein diacylglyceryl transferase n=1 Tax=Nocardioides litoris TaxID=1926648 RepID=UPI001FEBE380|nr:prolipoprotein diacylglyceryl transferase [Nocardioides litoris]